MAADAALATVAEHMRFITHARAIHWRDEVMRLSNRSSALEMALVASVKVH